MKILYAEDEMQLSMAVTEILKLEGFDVVPVYNGRDALEKTKSEYFDAVILDIMMPIMDGIEVLEAMRKAENFTPVLMLTAKTTTDDRINGLSVGADDYIGKPFAMKELVARLKSITRRNSQYKHTVLKCGNISLDCDTDELKSDNSSLRLSGKESELLALFIKYEDYEYTSEKINNLLWNGAQSESTVTLYISYLKNKLKQIDSDVNIVDTEKGYCLKKV